VIRVGFVAIKSIGLVTSSVKDIFHVAQLAAGFISSALAVTLIVLTNVYSALAA